jgi:hypothetical protein
MAVLVYRESRLRPDNPGRTGKSWLKAQIMEMVPSVKKQTRACRRLSVESAQGEISRSTSVESYSNRAQETPSRTSVLGMISAHGYKELKKLGLPLPQKISGS